MHSGPSVSPESLRFGLHLVRVARVLRPLGADGYLAVAAKDGRLLHQDRGAALLPAARCHPRLHVLQRQTRPDGFPLHLLLHGTLNPILENLLQSSSILEKPLNRNSSDSRNEIPSKLEASNVVREGQRTSRVIIIVSVGVPDGEYGADRAVVPVRRQLHLVVLSGYHRPGEQLRPQRDAARYLLFLPAPQLDVVVGLAGAYHRRYLHQRRRLPQRPAWQSGDQPPRPPRRNPTRGLNLAFFAACLRRQSRIPTVFSSSYAQPLKSDELEKYTTFS